MTATYSTPCLKDGNLVTTNGVVNSKVGVNHFICFSPADSKFFDIYNVMYVEGKETALDYEPYGYFFDVKVTGKNLFNKELIKKAMQGVSYLYVPIYVKKGSKVSFSYSKTLPSGLNFYVLLARDMGASYGSYSWLYHSTATSLCNNEGTFVADNDVISLSFFGSDLDIMIENLFNYLQIEISDKPTPYEPYTEQTVQIALDEPLRGIVRINDGKNVQEALNSSGITRRFKEVEITKDTLITYTLGQYGAPETNTVLCRYKDASLKKTGAILCGELKNINNWAKEEESVTMTEQGIDFRLSRERLGLGSDTTPEENKVAVIKYLTEHPLHCVAELNAPTTEPLPESVQAQLSSLHSENGTTHINIDSGEVEAGIKLTYRKEI